MESADFLLSSLLASTNDVYPDECGPEQDCYDRIKISFYFDGTGNNRSADSAAKKWSNVSRLFYGARDEPQNGIYAYYISGVGTPLNREEPWWKISKYVRDSGALGGGTGAGAESRLESGDLDMTDMLTRALEVATNKAGGRVKKIYEKNEEEGFTDLNKALGAHRLIKSIEVSVFGFSRGAALARAFVNRLVRLCDQDSGTLTYESYPIKFRFLGLFDTVASFGRPAKNDYDYVDLRLPQELQKCAHFVAAHEVRYSFPVDLIRQEGGYPGDWKEEVYPGAHSDVGGGYAPGSQTRSDTLARVPLIAMYKEAFVGGVRLNDWETISADVLTESKFLLPESTKNLYDSYIASLGAAASSGAVETRMQAHMQEWYAYKNAVTDTSSPDDARYEAQAKDHQDRIQEIDAKIEEIDGIFFNWPSENREIERLEVERNVIKDKLDSLQAGKAQIDDGQVTIAEEAAELREKRENGEPLVIGMVGAAGHYAFRSVAEPWMLDAYFNKSASSENINFFIIWCMILELAFWADMNPTRTFVIAASGNHLARDITLKKQGLY